LATPQNPRPARSPLARYAPVLAVVVIVAIVVAIIAVIGGGNDDKKKVTTDTSTTSNAKPTFANVPVFYNEAKAAGTLAKYKWADDCDTTTGLVKIPILNPPPCVALHQGDNGGATAPGVSATTIKIGYYLPKPDPLYDSIFRAAGAYDPPEQTAQAYKDYVDIYAHQYDFSGRKIELVKIQGTGSSTDEVAAKADADKAAAAGVFGVIGGPAQTQSFQTELARKKVMCIGACIIAAPQSFDEANAPYIWPTGPTPEETALLTTELVKKQLGTGNAVYAGDADLRKTPRKYALLSYDTPNGEYKESWDNFYDDLKKADLPVAGHISYFLNPSSLATDGRTVANKLKATGATTIIFTGDPIFPSFLTKNMTEQDYFPEWVMAGTVLADTVVFARQFDQQQWKHAMGLELTPARLPKPEQDAYTLHEWWFGTQPPTQNNFGIIKGDVELAMNGLYLAGANLTPDTFQEGLDHMPPKVPGPLGVNTITTYGDHGFWDGNDPGGLDNVGVLFWDPDATGPDETGTEGKGMYRLMDGGKRYLHDQFPTEPMKLFDPANTVTLYEAGQIPAELKPKPVPVPADAPANK
jgi:hypothetical protein